MKHSSSSASTAAAATIEGGDEEETDDIDQVVIAQPGEKGVVSVTISPPAEGQIKYSGSFWRATAEEEIEKGEIISIVKQDGLIVGEILIKKKHL